MGRRTVAPSILLGTLYVIVTKVTILHIIPYNISVNSLIILITIPGMNLVIQDRMKCTYMGIRRVRIIVMVVVMAMVYAPVFAAGVRMSWNPNQESNLLGYNVYYGTVSHVYSSSINAGTSTAVEIGDLQPGQTYYMAVTAYNAGGESEFSDEVSITMPAGTDAMQSLDSDSQSASGGGGGGCFIATTAL